MDFPGDAVGKNFPANAGRGTGPVLALGRSHMLQSNESPCTTTTEACVPQGKPLQ